MISAVIIGREGFESDDSEHQEEGAHEYSDDRGGGGGLRHYSERQRSEFANWLPAFLEHLTIRNCYDTIFGCVAYLFCGLNLRN
jgi:hypothetical protein